MWDFEPVLHELARSVEPSLARKAAASRSQHYLRELLRSGQFEPRIHDIYLSGSYARNTALHPVDDVDLVMVIEPEGWSSRLWDARPDPRKLLQSFAGAVRYRYHRSSVYVQRRSICLELEQLKIDVVPAITCGPDDDAIEIPDTDSNEWIKSAPKRHTRIATDINHVHGGLFKPFVKLVKNWNYGLPQTARLKSFAIETLAATLFKHVELPTLQEGLRLFFDFLAGMDEQAVYYQWPDTFGVRMNWWAHELPDLAGSGSNLLAKVDGTRRKKFLEHAVRSRDRLIQSERARQWDAALGHLKSAVRV